MAKWKEWLERMFSATAFAECGQREEALRLAQLEPLEKPLSVEAAFAAVAFGEANCPEMARELLGIEEKILAKDPVDFATAVGLRGVRIWYGVAHLAA